MKIQAPPLYWTMRHATAAEVAERRPTIPQCYIEGEFIGGCDLMIEMYQNGELQV